MLMGCRDGGKNYPSWERRVGGLRETGETGCFRKVSAAEESYLKNFQKQNAWYLFPKVLSTAVEKL